MVPIPVFWTKYTATMRGRAMKVVPCENCSTEYIYILEREASGVGTSVYMLNNEGAAGHAQSAAGDTLKEVLDNDFDPVPCPACGHYQRYMFSKLRETKGMGIVVITIALLMIGVIAAVGALRCSLDYLQNQSEADFRSMFTAWAVLLVVCLIGFGLSVLNNRKMRRFDPNVADQQARIAIGRSRAVTRAEFEKIQQEDKRG
ncbi:MAG TPA: hypothetical protein VMF69_22565 [Gemmataceae bacterium]|nr:hypothetical protein [Gemmataceae bacterium]